MNAIVDFLSPEAGQQRRKWLNEQEDKLGDLLSYWLGPDLAPTVKAASRGVEIMSPVTDTTESMAAAGRGDYLDSAINAAPVVAPIVMGGVLSKMGANSADDIARALEEAFAGWSATPEAVAGRDFVANEAGNLKLPPIKRSTDLPDIRGMDVDEAIRVARQEPHLIKAGNQSEGAYVGGPRNVLSKRDLNKVRKEADSQVALGAEGGDWYDRYRAGVENVTGGDPEAMDWMTAMHGQYSAGVSPEGELAFTLKDLNSGIATGKPVKAARPAQQEATIRALAENDPTKFQLGKKTGEYARRIHPKAAEETTATGVNDFRHARTLGYTEASGEAQRNAVTDASHRFMDFETALMADRANQANLAGRSNWTGEQIQAAPWVQQKADDFYARQTKGYLKKAREVLPADASEEALEGMARRIAFDEANRTIADFFPKHTAYGTWEAQPFVDAGHLPGLANADETTRALYAADPRSSWQGADGRDLIYSGYGVPDTGYSMRVRPSIETKGMYTPPGGAMETNPGMTARPLVAFDSSKAGHKIPDADRSMMDTAEGLRAYIDAQGAGAWHKPQFGGVPVSERNMFRVTRAGDDTPLTMGQLEDFQRIGEKYGIGEILDTGDGVTMTTFSDNMPDLGAKKAKELLGELRETFGDIFNVGAPGRMDGNAIGYEDEWTKGGVTQRLLDALDEAPAGVRESLDRNVDISSAAQARMLRDEDWAASMGATRSDIQRAREIIAQGPGYIARLREAVERGEILPALAAALIGGSALAPPSGTGQEPALQ